MKSKVTLKELLVEQIFMGVLIATYYWMWAGRNEWNELYSNIRSIIFSGTLIFFIVRAIRIGRNKKESFDELATVNLKRCDSVCLKIAVVFMVIAAFLGAVENITGTMVGYILVFMLVALAVIRTIIFWVMDSKGV